MNKKILAIPLVLAFLIAGCAKTVTEQSTQLEAGLAVAVQFLVKGREPCVNPAVSGKCLIDDAAFRKIDPIVQGINSALDKVKAFEATNQEAAAQQWLDVAKGQLKMLNDLVAKVRALIPITFIIDKNTLLVKGVA